MQQWPRCQWDPSSRHPLEREHIGRQGLRVAPQHLLDVTELGRQRMESPGAACLTPISAVAGAKEEKEVKVAAVRCYCSTAIRLDVD